MDSLRYWVTGDARGRLPLRPGGHPGARAARGGPLSSFLDIIHQDPVISQVKLIAEPWDMGEGGYQVGNFPVLWAEWNGKYRDTVRRFWKGDESQVAELAYRLTGSSDLTSTTGAGPPPASTSSPPTTALR